MTKNIYIVFIQVEGTIIKKIMLSLKLSYPIEKKLSIPAGSEPRAFVIRDLLLYTFTIPQNIDITIPQII